jgi:hypothetical protein
MAYIAIDTSKISKVLCLLTIFGVGEVVIRIQKPQLEQAMIRKVKR